jgi:hypothetical protein
MALFDSADMHPDEFRAARIPDPVVLAPSSPTTQGTDYTYERESRENTKRMEDDSAPLQAPVSSPMADRPGSVIAGREENSAGSDDLDAQALIPARAILSVSSNNAPVVADVFLDNSRLGVTDRAGRFEIVIVMVGRQYQIKVVSDGYQTLTRTVTIAQKIESLVFDLKRDPKLWGEIVIDVSPDTDSILVDNQLHSGTMPLRLPVRTGAHTVRLVNTRLQEVSEQRVNIAAAETVNIDHQFAIETGKVAVSLENVEEYGFGYVYVDGEIWRGQQNTTPIVVELPVGPHTVSVKRDGFQNRPDQFEVITEKGQTKYVSFTLIKLE